MAANRVFHNLMTLTRNSTWARLAIVVLAVYWIALAIATHVPKLPSVSLQHGDKIAHYVAYALLAIFLSWAWTTRRRYVPWGIVFAWGTAVLYGAIDELTQIPIPGRYGDWYDWCADSVGALTGIGLFWAADSVRRALRRQAVD